MSMNWALAVGAVFVASMGTIAGACKRPGARGTPATSAIPNNSVHDNTAGLISSKSKKAEASRGLGAALAAW
jgi:hypothetical protein